ncbi:MAG: hypothetical protein E7317_11035 [Clostridiales bacterium]|nr:hypothetical protein [Clostridiales bacterium]
MAWNTRREVRSRPSERLTDAELDALTQAVVDRMGRVNDEYLRRMGEHIAEIGELWPSDVHRLQQMRRMRKGLAEMQRKIAAACEASSEDIARIFAQTARTDARMAAKVLGGNYATVNNVPLQRIVRGQLRETVGRMRNLANTTVVSEYYRDAIDEAVTLVQSGVEDYGSAMRRALREAGEHGLSVVEYESGHRRRLDSAVRMNVLDGVRHLNQSIMEEVGRQFGADGVEIDAHMLCAEDHLPYQGGQYSNEEFEEIQDGLQRPFGEWNCRHTWHPIMMGISPRTYTDGQLEEMRAYSTEEVTIDGRTKTRYQWSQEMRRIETAVRKEKDVATLARYAGDEELRRQCQGRILALNERYREVAGGAGVRAEFGRTFVRGFVDDLPVGSSGPSVSTGGLSTAGLGNHESVIAGMVGKSDATIQQVWNKNASELRVLDAHHLGNAYCEGRNGVRFDIDRVANGTDYKAPYQTAFHEFGHQIDFLSGRNGLPISYTYKNDLLSRTAMRESREHLNEFFRNNFKKYYPSLSRRDILRTAPNDRSVRLLADQFAAGTINVDQVLTNQRVFDTLMALAGKQMERDFCNLVKARYKERERVDISDIFEPTTKVNYPFGIGHRYDHPTYWYRAGNHGTEIFAEMFSAEIGNHASLKAIKEFYPETYKVFREILEVIK